MVVVFLLFAAPLFPCWYAFPYFEECTILYNMLFVPLYLRSYSILVIVTRWLVIGRYKECRMVTPSFAYLRWWSVDQLVCIWECWVGWLILDTPLLWLFYWFMGARVSPFCQLAGFIREFDLITIGPFASLK